MVISSQTAHKISAQENMSSYGDTKASGIDSAVAKRLSGMSERMKALQNSLETLIEKKYSPHPYSHGVTHENVKSVMSEFLTMSKAFPYIQAAAHYDIFEKFLSQKSQAFGKNIETTFAVASFLVWDEIGAHYKITSGGQNNLPNILRTSDFHANMLEDDLKVLFGESPNFGFSDQTISYLKALKAGLSSFDDITRIAYMVAFEMHAGVMIDRLWESLSALFPQHEKSSLLYFHVHVGGDDPAEAYHVEMTARMIESVVQEDQQNRFLELFEEAYKNNIQWTESTKNA